jgi:hypothetical protein
MLNHRHTFLAAIAAALCFPASSLAAQVYAAPAPQGAGDCSSPANACSIYTAFGALETGDELILAGDHGTYGTTSAPLTQTLQPPQGHEAIYIHGAAGQPMPVIYSKSSQVMDLNGWFNGQGYTVSDVDLEDLSTGGGSDLMLDGSADHVLAHATGQNVIVCNLGGAPGLTATVIDTTCIGGAAYDIGLWSQNNAPGADGLVLHNDTLESPAGYDGLQVNADNGADLTAAATNMIIGGSYEDIDAYDDSISSLALTIAHSDYRTVNTGGTTPSVTAPGTNDNSELPPRFADAAADDFREAPGSPTIWGGITSPADGTTDLDANPRVVAGHTDMGAYQAQPGTLSVLTTRARVRHREVRIRIRCSGGADGCTGRLRVTENITVVLGRQLFSLRSGRTVTYTLRLTHEALVLLEAAHRHRLSGRTESERSDGGSTGYAPITLVG